MHLNPQVPDIAHRFIDFAAMAVPRFAYGDGQAATRLLAGLENLIAMSDSIPAIACSSSLSPQAAKSAGCRRPFPVSLFDR
jgi:hypothetical protein